MSEALTTQKPETQAQTVARVINSMKEQFAMALPSNAISPERMVRVFITCVNKSPQLAKALTTPQGKVALLGVFMRCAELGIEPDGYHAHIIPYGVVPTLIIDYKGLVELVMRTGNVSKIHSDIVCENDIFEYNKGTVEKHNIDFRKPRGETYAVYCEITMKDGTVKAEVMSKSDVDAIRSRSKSGNSGPWVTDYNEMAKKTVFKRAVKWVSISPELKNIIDYDNEEYQERKNLQRTAKESFFGTTQEKQEETTPTDVIDVTPEPQEKDELL